MDSKIILKAMILGLLTLGCQEEKSSKSIDQIAEDKTTINKTTEDKVAESLPLRANRIAEWVLETYDMVHEGFAEAESELRTENRSIEKVLEELLSLIRGKASEARKRRKQLFAIKKELLSLREKLAELSSSSERKPLQQKIAEVEVIIDGRLKDMETFDFPFIEKLDADFHERVQTWRSAVLTFQETSFENAGKKTAKLLTEYLHEKRLGFVIIQRKAAWGDTDSQFSLGLICEKEQNYESAIDWFLRAEKQKTLGARAYAWQIYDASGNRKLASALQVLSEQFPQMMLRLRNDSMRIAFLSSYLQHGASHLLLLRQKNKIENDLAVLKKRISQGNTNSKNLRLGQLNGEFEEISEKVSQNFKVLEKLREENIENKFPLEEDNGISIKSKIIPSKFGSEDAKEVYRAVIDSMIELTTLYKQWNSPIMEMRIRQLEDVTHFGRWGTEMNPFFSDIDFLEKEMQLYNSRIDEHIRSAKSIDANLSKILMKARHTIDIVNLAIGEAGFPSLDYRTKLDWYPIRHKLQAIKEFEGTTGLMIALKEMKGNDMSDEIGEMNRLISLQKVLLSRRKGMPPRIFSLCIPTQFHADTVSNEFPDFEMNNLLNLSALLEQCSIEFTISILYCTMSEEIHAVLEELGGFASDGEAFLTQKGIEVIHKSQRLNAKEPKLNRTTGNRLLAPLISRTEKLRLCLSVALKEVASIAKNDRRSDPIETLSRLNQVFESFVREWKSVGCPPMHHLQRAPPTQADLLGQMLEIMRSQSAQKAPDLSADRIAMIACMHRRASLLAQRNPSEFLPFMKFASYYYLNEWSWRAQKGDPNAILLMAMCYRNGLFRPKNQTFSNELIKVANNLKTKF